MIGDIETTVRIRTTRTQTILLDAQDLARIALDRALSDGNGFIGEPAAVHVMAYSEDTDGRVQRNEEETDLIITGLPESNPGQFVVSVTFTQQEVAYR